MIRRLLVLALALLAGTAHAGGGFVGPNGPRIQVAGAAKAASTINFSTGFSYSLSGGTLTLTAAGGGGNATSLQGFALSATAPTDVQILAYSAGGATWLPIGITTILGAGNVTGALTATGGNGSQLAVRNAGITSAMLSTGAAAANLGAPGGVLSGVWPNPSLADGAVSVATQLGANVVTANALAGSSLRLVTFLGHNGTGACTAPGLRAGDVVIPSPINITDGSAVGFETTISVTGQIQQTSGADYSAVRFIAVVVAKGP